MPHWTYSALDAQGRRQRGSLKGDSPRHARNLLRERGLQPLELRPARTSSSVRRLWPGKRRSMGNEPLAQICRQLSALLRGGLPLDTALKALVDQRSRHSVVLTEVRARV